MNQTVLSTTPSLIEFNHSRCQSLDFSSEMIAPSLLAKNQSIDYGLSRASSWKSSKSDTETLIHKQSSIVNVPPATGFPSPDMQVIIFFWVSTCWNGIYF